MSGAENEIRTAFAADPFGTLRRRWRHVPAGAHRYDTGDLLTLPENDLLAFWRERRRDATTGAGYPVRGWYHDLYRNAFAGKNVLDLGCGLGMDGISYAEAGARVTFADIVPENLEIVARLCRVLDIKATTVHLADFAAIDALPGPFDAIYAQGSLIHMPADLVCDEIQRLLRHLPVGGRWVELAYPRARWKRDGAPPFTEWGRNTDGEGTPWAEWCDLDKRLDSLAPAQFDPILAFNFHGDDFNWFDLVRRA